MTLSIINVVGSTIAKETDYTIYTMAGPEIAVATTKAFSAQLVLLYILAIAFARKLGRISPKWKRNCSPKSVRFRRKRRRFWNGSI